MTQEKMRQASSDIHRDIKALKERMADYDWHYRLSRFDEKIETPKEEAVSILETIKLSDNNKYSENKTGKECQLN